MLILIIILLLIIFIWLLYQLFKLVVWISKKKIRIQRASTLLGVFILGMIINQVFFTKMEFIQSNVYPNLYLVKNPIEDKDSIRSAMKELVLEQANKNFIGQEAQYKRKGKHFREPELVIGYDISFYAYYKSWGTIPFGEAGTAHFIENEEDPGGFSSELLQHYEQYRMAKFELFFCKNDTINYLGNINYFENRDIISTDTIINLCQIQ